MTAKADKNYVTLEPENIKTATEQLSNAPTKLVALCNALSKGQIVSMIRFLHEHNTTKKSEVSYRNYITKTRKEHEDLLAVIDRMDKDSDYATEVIQSYKEKTGKSKVTALRVKAHLYGYVLNTFEEQVGVNGVKTLMQWYSQASDIEKGIDDSRARELRASRNRRYYLKKKAEQMEKEKELGEGKSSFNLNDAINNTKQKEEEKAPRVDATSLMNRINNSIKKEDRDELKAIVNECQSEEDLQEAKALIDETIKGYSTTPKKEEMPSASLETLESERN